jgi:hypothetical protein
VWFSRTNSYISLQKSANLPPIQPSDAVIDEYGSVENMAVRERTKELWEKYVPPFPLYVLDRLP